MHKPDIVIIVGCNVSCEKSEGDEKSSLFLRAKLIDMAIYKLYNIFRNTKYKESNIMNIVVKVRAFHD